MAFKISYGVQKIYASRVAAFFTMTKCKNKYGLPLKKKDIKSFHKRTVLHKGPLMHALDFVCEEGSPVYAAASGKVVWLRGNSKVVGVKLKSKKDVEKYWETGNRIVIKHKNDEYTAYEHLKYKGVVVKVGQKVRKGQLIGYSGNSGISKGPHLHFDVFINPIKQCSEGSETLMVVFKELKH